MSDNHGLSRRKFLLTTGAVVGGAATYAWPAVVSKSTPIKTDSGEIAALRREIVDSPISVALHRAKAMTRVFQKTEGQPWVVRKAKGLREYYQTVPLYIRPNDGIAGSISERPGAMPVMVELGIAENNIYLSEYPQRAGYLKDQVPDDIRKYWLNDNLWGLFRTRIMGQPPLKDINDLPQTTGYKFIANQGHLSPSYGELLKIGLGGMIGKVRARRKAETDADRLAFLDAAEQSLLGLSEWIHRYSEFLSNEAKQCNRTDRAAELREMSRICGKVANDRPETFREALQLLWFAHQAIHIEGHGYSCTPDHVDQLLLPFYEADRKAGRLNDAQVMRLAENFTLKMYDNSFWGPEHHLTQGLCLGGSTPDGDDLTNRLSWLFLEAATNLGLPEPLIWIRWHPRIDQEFFAFCLARLAKSTCFPMMWNDKVVPEGLMALGVDRRDAYNYIAVGCNELAVPGQCYYNPGASVNYLVAIESALTGGTGYKKRQKNSGPNPDELKSFDQFAAAVGLHIRRNLEWKYSYGMKELQAQMEWGQTPLTSCFFDGCIDNARDMAQGTKYNILSCGGSAFANAVDCMAAIREVVYEKHEATLAEVAIACAANFKGHERLRAKLIAASKQGNDDPRLDDVIKLVERLRDEPMKEICRDPRDGRQFGNSHVVRSGAVLAGLATPATPDGRLAGTPVASSVAAAAGCERSGPTAVLNSVCKLDSAKSWQQGYQVNIRFHSGMVADPKQREKLRAMLNVYFANGGQELQINIVDTETLRAAQKNPDQYRDLVVRVAGFSEFFVNLTPAMQEEIIARAVHQ